MDGFKKSVGIEFFFLVLLVLVIPMVVERLFVNGSKDEINAVILGAYLSLFTLVVLRISMFLREYTSLKEISKTCLEQGGKLIDQVCVIRR